MTLGGDRAPVAWRVAAEDRDGLRARLDELVAAPGSTSRSQSVGSGEPVRLAVVEPTERKLRLAARLVATGDRWGGRSDIWFSPQALAAEGAGAGGAGAGGGKVAFLFPGVEPTFGAAATNLGELAGLLGLAPPDVTEDTVAHRSAAIVRLGIFLDRVLRRLGIAPDLVGGHSIGEWSGAVSVGMATAEAAEVLITSVDLDGVDLPQVDFAALVAGAVLVTEALGGLPGVEVSHDNCSRQSVICGAPDRVAEAMAVLGRHNVLGQVLDFRSGFHTSALVPHIGYLRGVIDSFPLRPDRTVPLWSATTCAPLPDDLDDVREIITRHLVETVRFRPMVERMYDDGARVFVQPGIGNLVGFVDDILGDRPHAAVPVLTAKRPALAQLHRALAALWVEGIDAIDDVDAVEAVEDVEPAVPPEPAQASAPVAEPVPAPIVAPVVVHPVLAAAAGVMHNASLATQQVVTAWANARATIAPRQAPVARRAPVPVARVGAPAPAPALTPVPTPAPAEPGPSGWPTERFTVVHRVSLDMLPETFDHTLYRQPEGWTDVSDTFPIVAMTSQLQILADVASRYAGGRDVVALSDVRNYRWLDISEPVDLDVTITPDGDDTLRIALGPYCRAKVRVGAYPAPTRYEHAPLRNPRAARKVPDQLWDERLMFHGPRFHGIRRLGPVGDDGLWGELQGMPDPGPLLDNVGKLIAYWTMEQRGWGEAPLPIGVAKVEFSRPGPEPGEPVPADVRIESMDDDFIVGEAVLCRADGTTWCHIEGWRMHIFHRDEVMDPLTRWVEDFQAIDVEPDGLLLQYERWPSTPSRDLYSHQELRREERVTYESMTPADRRAWLLEVVAAKEATRAWLQRHLRRASFPVEVVVRDEGDGRWVATSSVAPDREPHLALSRVGWLVAAVIAEAPDGPGSAAPPLAVDLRPVPDGADGDAVAASLADALRERHPGVPVGHRALPPAEVGGNAHGPLAVAWTTTPDLPPPPPRGLDLVTAGS